MTEDKSPRPWGVYDSGSERLSEVFGAEINALGFASLGQVADHLQGVNPHRPVTGLELAGQGRAFDELGIEGVACCLAFPNFLAEETESGLVRRETQHRIALVPGDVAVPSTWSHIKERIQCEQLAQPNLILHTPGTLGLFHIPDGPTFFSELVECVIGLADPDEFVFLGEVSDGLESLRACLGQIEKEHNVKTTCKHQLKYVSRWPERITVGISREKKRNTGCANY